jgi:predicted permease
MSRMIPDRWRASVAGDLDEEAQRDGRRGWRRRLWTMWQTAKLGAELRLRGARPFASQPEPRRGPMWNLLPDLRFAWRMVRRQPWSSAAIVVTLALGIGATTAVYAVFNYAVFRPVPGIGEPDGLVSVYVSPDHGSRFRYTMSHAHLRAVRQVPAFEGLAGYGFGGVPGRLDPDGTPEVLEVIDVSQGYFDVLRVQPLVGRLFHPAEYEAPDTFVAVISEHLWRTRYASDPGIVGRQLQARDQLFTIVGVADAYRGLARIGDEDIWVPFGARRAIGKTHDQHQNMIGRLRPGMALSVAREQASVAVASVGAIRVRDDSYTAVVYAGISDGIGLTRSRLMNLYWTVMAGVGMLFLLACANAANLLVSRNVARRRDLALKSALGAARGRVLRELTIEAGVIAVAASVLGLTLAAGLIRLFSTERLLDYGPTLEGLQLDWRVAIFAMGAAALTVAAASGLPSVMAARWSPVRGLRDFARGSASTGRVRTGLVLVQVALSTALVASALVIGRTLSHLEHPDLGFETDGLLAMFLRPGDIGYDDERTTAFYREVEDRLLTVPGVSAVGYGYSGHIGFGSGWHLRRPDEPPDTEHDVLARYVSAGYFDAVGIRLLAGRFFTAGEARQLPRPPLVVFEESAAREIFGTFDVVGRHVVSGRDTLEIVGVVADTGSENFREGHQPTIYLPPGSIRIATFQIRTTLPVPSATRSIRDAVRAIEPNLPSPAIVTTQDQLRRLAAQERVIAKLGSLLAALALGLAVAGTYAVVARRVVERTREFGIRLALGATGGAIAGPVLRRAVVTSGVGIVAGLGLYAWASRFIASRLYEVSALDPASLGLAAGALALAGLVAAWLPARRATRVDPTVALRAE